MKAKFIDSSVFLHAYLKPRRELAPNEIALKRAAQRVISRIEEGEPVITTVVHISEIANVVESRLGLATSLGLIIRLLSLDNIEVVTVSSIDYERALPISQKYAVSLNDALAFLKMEERGLSEVYTLDRHFMNLPGLIVLPQLK